MTNITYTVYINDNGRAVAAGNVTAPSYAEAKAFVISTGRDEKDFMLIKVKG